MSNGADFAGDVVDEIRAPQMLIQVIPSFPTDAEAKTAETWVNSGAEARMSGERGQAIRQRACEIWEQEGRPDGKERAHWLQAEAEIEAEPVYGVTNNGKILKSYHVDPTVSGRRRSAPRREKPKVGAD